jgi:hypothetical protein
MVQASLRDATSPVAFPAVNWRAIFRCPFRDIRSKLLLCRSTCSIPFSRCLVRLLNAPRLEFHSGGVFPCLDGRKATGRHDEKRYDARCIRSSDAAATGDRHLHRGL